MIWLAVAYWLTINTIGVGVIIGSMCNGKQQEEYSPDHFKNMVEENNVKVMNNILKGILDYFSTRTSNSVYEIHCDTYRKSSI